MLMLILLGALSSVSKFFLDSEKKVQSMDGGRSSLELLTRELAPAVVDTRMQLVVIPGETLQSCGATEIAPQSPAIIWMAPLGKSGDLRCVGYYLTRNQDEKRYRLKRIYIRDDNPDGYFPKVINLEAGGKSMVQRTDPLSADWYTSEWDTKAFDEEQGSGDEVVVSTVASGVIAFWIQPLDHFGNGIPWLSQSVNHPSSTMMFNSAAYFHMAENSPFEDGSTFVYLREQPMVMKANRLPPEVEIAIVTVGDEVLNRDLELPEMINVFQDNGSLDLRGSLDSYLKKLQATGIPDAEAFITRVKLANGG